MPMNSLILHYLQFTGTYFYFSVKFLFLIVMSPSIICCFSSYSSNVNLLKNSTYVKGIVIEYSDFGQPFGKHNIYA